MRYVDLLFSLQIVNYTSGNQNQLPQKSVQKYSEGKYGNELQIDKQISKFIEYIIVFYKEGKEFNNRDCGIYIQNNMTKESLDIETYLKNNIEKYQNFDYQNYIEIFKEYLKNQGISSQAQNKIAKNCVKRLEEINNLIKNFSQQYVDDLIKNQVSDNIKKTNLAAFIINFDKKFKQLNAKGFIKENSIYLDNVTQYMHTKEVMQTILQNDDYSQQLKEKMINLYNSNIQELYLYLMKIEGQQLYPNQFVNKIINDILFDHVYKNFNDSNYYPEIYQAIGKDRCQFIKDNIVFYINFSYTMYGNFINKIVRQYSDKQSQKQILQCCQQEFETIYKEKERYLSQILAGYLLENNNDVKNIQYNEDSAFSYIQQNFNKNDQQNNIVNAIKEEKQNQNYYDIKKHVDDICKAFLKKVDENKRQIKDKCQTYFQNNKQDDKQKQDIQNLFAKIRSPRFCTQK